MKPLRIVEIILHILIIAIGISLLVKGFRAFNSDDFETASSGGGYIFGGFTLITFANMVVFIIFSAICAAQDNIKLKEARQAEIEKAKAEGREPEPTVSETLSKELENLSNSFKNAFASVNPNTKNANPKKRYKYCTFCDSRVEESVNECPYCGAHDFTESKFE